MCGIAGVLCPSGISVADLPAMGDALIHRGPDSFGYLLYDRERGIQIGQDLAGHISGSRPTVGFAHRRLSIIDITEESDQPFVDASGTYGLTYNGEIYNYIELRRELESRGHEFTTGGDTEVVLRAYAEWGQNCVDRFVGMWAFALVDHKRGMLFLSRDRFGIKPLFFSLHGDSFYFASEIKGLRATAAIPSEPEEQTVEKFLLESRTDDSELTFFRGIFQLRPAHNLTVPIDGPVSPTTWRYWQIPRDSSPDADAPARFRTLLADAICIHARSDVPVGTCLSGGLDSSGIVCIADALRVEGRIPRYAHAAFGYVTPSAAFSERPHMEEVVAQTRIEMTYVAPSSADFVAALPTVLRQQDEPFGSASIAAQWFVFRSAREAGMKVMLDGQGADEVIGGYPSYLPIAATSLLRQRRLGEYARAAIAQRRMLGRFPNAPREVLRELAPASVGATMRALRGGADRTAESVSPGAAVLVTSEFRERTLSRRPKASIPRSLNDLLAAETASQNLPALLRFEDRNSMAHSIEARVPFLDHRLVELSFGLSDDWKIRGATTKRVLREALRGVIPESIRTRRDKIGFRADPAVTWSLAGRSRDTIVANRTPYEEKWFDAAAVARLLDSSDRSTEAEFLVWRVLSIKSWLRAIWGDSDTLLA
jgi:asparagine synthase (glutamine-hydrolysing)